MSDVGGVSATVPDWSREAPRRLLDPGRRFLAAHRALERAGPRRGLRRTLALLRHHLWSVIGGIDIPPATRIGGGLMLPHPNGVVFHPDAVLGPNCLVMQQVTLGTGGRPGAPRLGGHVDVGPGARVLGGVTVGDHAVIGANAVVTRDVEPHAVVAGVPARVIGTTRDAPSAAQSSE